MLDFTEQSGGGGGGVPGGAQIFGDNLFAVCMGHLSLAMSTGKATEEDWREWTVKLFDWALSNAKMLRDEGETAPLAHSPTDVPDAYRIGVSMVLMTALRAGHVTTHTANIDVIERVREVLLGTSHAQAHRMQ